MKKLTTKDGLIVQTKDTGGTRVVVYSSLKEFKAMLKSVKSRKKYFKGKDTACFVHLNEEISFWVKFK